MDESIISSESEIDLMPKEIIDEYPEFKTNVDLECMEDSKLAKIQRKFTKGYRYETTLLFILTLFNISVFSLPFSIQQSGIIITILLIIITNVLAYLSFRILTDVLLKINKRSYHQVIFILFGNKVAIFFDMINFAYMYLKIILGQYFAFKLIINIIISLIEIPFNPKYDILILGIMGIIQLPFTYVKNLTKIHLFKYISFIVVCIFYVSFLVTIFRKVRDGDKNLGKNIPVFRLTPDIFYSYSLIMFNFCCHNSFYKIFFSFKLMTEKRVYFCIRWALGIQLFFVLSATFIGYFANPQLEGKKEIVILGPEPNIFNIILQIILSFLLIVTSPLYFYDLKKLLKQENPKPEKVETNFPMCSINAESEEIEENRNAIIFPEVTSNTKIKAFIREFLENTTLLFIGSVMIYFIRSILFLTSLLGGLCVGILSFLFPMMIYNKIEIENKTFKKTALNIAFTLAMLISLLSTVYAFIDFNRNVNHPNPPSPPPKEDDE